MSGNYEGTEYPYMHSVGTEHQLNQSDIQVLKNVQLASTRISMCKLKRVCKAEPKISLWERVQFANEQSRRIKKNRKRTNLERIKNA